MRWPRRAYPEAFPEHGWPVGWVWSLYRGDRYTFLPRLTTAGVTPSLAPVASSAVLPEQRT
jgi:hypothetical protein